jgi:hypothetical protein
MHDNDSEPKPRSAQLQLNVHLFRSITFEQMKQEVMTNPSTRYCCMRALEARQSEWCSRASSNALFRNYETVHEVKPKLFCQHTYTPRQSQRSAGNPATLWSLYIEQRTTKQAQAKTYRERSAAQVLHKVLLSMLSGMAILNPLHSFL